MRTDIVLMNFKLPTALKSEFENRCRLEYISMTTKLNQLIQNYIQEFHFRENLIDPPVDRLPPAEMVTSNEFDTNSASDDKV